MKKIFSTVFILVALLAITTGTVFAGSALELVDVRNNQGGPTFIFRVTGEFSEGELNGGFVSVEGGEDYPLYCAQTDSDTVVCHTSKKVSGENVVVGFGGARFWVNVPDVRTHYCYSVWSWNLTTGPQWTDYGKLCQDVPGSLYDWVYYEDMIANPFYGNYVEFYNIDVSDNCPNPVPYNGGAYYSPICPEFYFP